MTATVKRLTLGLGAGLLRSDGRRRRLRPRCRIRIRIRPASSGGGARAGPMGQAGSVGRADPWACCRGSAAKSA